MLCSQFLKRSALDKMNSEVSMVESDSTNVVSNCLSCGQGISIFREGVFDTRLGIEGSYNICRCGSCGLIQLLTCLKPDELKSFYETYYNFGGNKEGLYTEFRKAFFASPLYHLWMAIDGDICFHSSRGKGRLLDVGCNEGQGLQIYQQNGFLVEGLELNERAASEARKRGFRVFTGPLEAFRPEKAYDVVVLSHILEHSVNPKVMIAHVARILKPGGQIWISCPNIESWQRDIFARYWINWHVPFHITFYSDRTLKSLLDSAGFKVIKIKFITPALWIAQSIIATLFAKKGKKNYIQRSPILLGFLMCFVRFTFFPFLWLGNLLGRGDCLTIEAKKKQAI
jgi:2-polyprenyl-3-methyl-5-hydroxy-6-metoxy-1,4-benzoquinol methylase